jgi:hypothetical protein
MGTMVECDAEFVTGECRAGIQTCLADGTWSGCEGAISPGAEVCDDGLDNDCDDEVDEPACEPRWSSDAGAPDAGVSDAGAPCGAERCGNGVDDDCDGTADEHCLSACTTVFADFTYIVDSSTDIAVEGTISGNEVPVPNPGYCHRDVVPPTENDFSVAFVAEEDGLYLIEASPFFGSVLDIYYNCINGLCIGSTAMIEPRGTLRFRENISLRRGGTLTVVPESNRHESVRITLRYVGPIP